MAPIRRAVAITPINRTIYNAVSPFLAAGQSVRAYVENVSTTDAVVASLAEAAPPTGAAGALWSTSGNLINILAYTAGSGLEIHIDEGTDGDSNWYRSDQFLVTPSLPAFERAFRFTMHYGRITMYNGGTGTISAKLTVRVSTM